MPIHRTELSTMCRNEKPRRQYLSVCLAVVALMVSGVGCGGGGHPRGVERFAGAARFVPWTVSKVLGPNRLRVVSFVGDCGARDRTRSGTPVVVQSASKVYVGVEVERSWNVGGRACAGIESVVYTTVQLDIAIDQVELFDLSSDPPVRRDGDGVD